MYTTYVASQNTQITKASLNMFVKIMCNMDEEYLRVCKMQICMLIVYQDDSSFGHSVIFDES